MTFEMWVKNIIYNNGFFALSNQMNSVNANSYKKPTQNVRQKQKQNDDKMKIYDCQRVTWNYYTFSFFHFVLFIYFFFLALIQKI